jgi:anti-anti-sigma regulatory factor
MLRLTRIVDSDLAQAFSLQGKLVGPWVEEVRAACAAGTDPFSLDLSGLTFVDTAGASLLLDLIGRGVKVVRCSGYVAELLRPHLVLRNGERLNVPF